MNKENSKKQFDVISISHFFHPRVGGLEKMAYRVLNTYQENGYNCLAIHGGDITKQYKLNGYEVHSHRSKNLFDGTYPVFGLKFAWKLLNTFRKNPNATVLVYDRHLISSVWTSLVCTLLRRKYIVITQTTDSNFFKNKLFQILGKVLDMTIFKYVIRRADHVICVSKTNRRYIYRHFGVKRKNTTVIYNCFVGRNKPYQYKKVRKVLFATKWIEVKNPDLVAKAFLTLSKKYPSWEFNYVGKGDSMIQDINNIPQNLKVLERFLHTDELENELKNTAIYVNASWQEGLSLGLVEAMGYGVVPVVSAAPANKEAISAIENHNLVFKRGSIKQIVESLEYVIKMYDKGTTEFSKLSAKTQDIAYEKFSYKNSMDKYLEFLKEYQSNNG